MDQEQETLADVLAKWSETNLDIGTSLTLLSLVFVLKLVVDKTFGSKDLMQSLCELPIDIGFAALAFMIAFIVSDKPHAAQIGITLYTGILILALLIMVAGRRAGRLFENREPFKGTLFLLMSMVVSVYILIQSIQVFNKEKSSGEQKTEMKDNDQSNG